MIPSLRRIPWGLAALAALMAANLALPAQAANDDESRIRLLTERVAASYDSARGGFITRKGAPQESAIELAWRLAGEGDRAWRFRARRGVEWTWTLYDSVGGGFLQGERDARKDFATFEKRTDANAWRLENRVDAWLDARSEAGQSVGSPAVADRRAIRQILDYFDRVLLDARGGFVAGQIGDREMVPAANGTAIRATLRWAAASGEPHWRDFAWKSLDRLWAQNWTGEFGFLRRGTFNEALSVPRLDDQVEMGRAFVMAAHVAGRAADLDRARKIGDVLLTHFEDRKQGGMRVQVALAKDGRVKNAARDPEENARAARFLVELASITGDARYRDAARRLVDLYVPERNKPEPDDADWVLAMRGLVRAELPERPEWKVPAKSEEPATPRTTRFGKVRR